jgi:hypothetical protein
LRLKRIWSWAAQFGNCALAEVTAVSDASAAAIRVLDKVIVVLRILFCAENSRQRSLLLCWERFLKNLLDSNYVGIASEKARRVIITLARTAQMTATASPNRVRSELSTRHSCFGGVDNCPDVANAARRGHSQIAKYRDLGIRGRISPYRRSRKAWKVRVHFVEGEQDVLRREV